MSLSSQNATDYQYVEGVETVTLKPLHPDRASISGVKGLNQAFGGGGAINNGALGIDSGDAKWHLWTATLQGVEPQNGDVIQDASGQEWTILSVGESKRSGRFVCNCRQQV